MHSEQSRTQGGFDDFGLEDRVLKELKEKAITAKGRAYCRCCDLSIHPVYTPALVPHSIRTKPKQKKEKEGVFFCRKQEV